MPRGQLNGCIKDTRNMRDLLTSILGQGDIEMHLDDTDLKGTSYDGIVSAIFNMSLKAIKEKLELVVIHYSGHGSQVQDTNNDEDDGMDEVICPSDYDVHGMLKDDIISYLLSGFPSFTRVVTVFDSCHSGTITDLPLQWNGKTCKKINNNRIQAKIISISGCTDNQTSLDTSAGGMLTTTIIKLLRTNKRLCENVFDLVTSLNGALSNSGARQRSVLCSSFDLTEEPHFLPVQPVQPVHLSREEFH